MSRRSFHTIYYIILIVFRDSNQIIQKERIMDPLVTVLSSRRSDITESIIAYAKDTYDFIDKPHYNLLLEETTLKGDIIGKSLKLNKVTQISGDVIAKNGHVVAKDCKRLNHLKAEKGSIKATRCKKLGEVTAKGDVILQDCPNVMGVSSKNGLISISNGNIFLTVRAKDKLKLENSKIRQLSCEISSIGSIIIKNCYIKFLYVNQSFEYPTKPSPCHQDTLETTEPPSEMPAENLQQNFTGNAETKLNITLTNSHVEKVIFSTHKQGTVTLLGNSIVKKILNGKLDSNL